jgi:Family of unknown function (DUF5713)
MSIEVALTVTRACLVSLVLLGEAIPAYAVDGPSEHHMTITNAKMSNYVFLREMAADRTYPSHLVKKGQAILVRLCEDIEKQKPKSLQELYALTHHATEQFNELGHQFEEEGSEIETVARENIGDDVATIAKAYGFDADTEELIAPREW